MSFARDRDDFSALRTGFLRFINDERTGAVIVERTNDRHVLSSGAASRIARLSQCAAPGLVLLLDLHDQLAGTDRAERLVSDAPDRFDAVHALCFPSGLSDGKVEFIRRREIGRGLWEVAFSTGQSTPEQLETVREAQVLQRWLNRILDRLESSGADADAGDSIPSAQQDDDGRRGGPAMQPDSIARRIALRDQLLRDVPWIAAENWNQLSGNRGKNPSAALGKYKTAGRLFAVPHGNRDLYPTFQFSEEDARPKPAIARVLKLVPEAARGWPLLSWFNAPNVLLNGRAPLDAIDTDTEAVVDAAERFYGYDD